MMDIRPRTLAAALLLAVLPVSAGAQAPEASPAGRTKVHRPNFGPDPRGLSSKPSMITPQLLRSLEYAQQALAIALRAQSKQELQEAARLIFEAYVYQRASHGAINIESRGNNKPGSTFRMQDKTIDASRKNLISAQFHLKQAGPSQTSRIQMGIDFLNAAIGQTRAVLAVRGG
ncbi:MAG: hypothetical protein L0027_02645 [Candidatus Rokubacteria bacterium]|nr:hypothetical protein [Candidatus Rokubacteria bacterium]